MIVPMKKITLLALETDKECLVKKLKKQGVVHVEKVMATGEGLTKLTNTERDLSIVKNLLSEFVPKKQVEEKPSYLGYDETLTFANNVLGLYESHKEDITKVGKISEELSRCEIWGNFNLKDFEFLKERNIKLIPLEMSLKAFSDVELTKSLKLILVNTKNKVSHALAIL